MANFPMDAIQVRDAIANAMRPHVNHNSSMDTGAGLGSADLWLQIGDREYFVSVQPGRSLPPIEPKEAER